MDILVLLLLFALYVIPEVLRRTRKPKKYEYPQFPTTDPKAENPPATSQGRKPQAFKPQPFATTVPNVVAAAQPTAQPTTVTQPLPADEPVALSNLAYGLVMAEILGPPRSLNKLGWKRQ
ncbi:MAG: hypothetical protein K0Q77_2768 [Anaerosporomusa subterranea]|jgi:hypothetical protein|nr:hypothetical protein [Anaerosporomusa subterranea]